jgi:hypothetical protein
MPRFLHSGSLHRAGHPTNPSFSSQFALQFRQADPHLAVTVPKLDFADLILQHLDERGQPPILPLCESLPDGNSDVSVCGAGSRSLICQDARGGER